MGGLGNQLFQIFNVLSLSLTYRIPFIFEYSELLTTGITRRTYWNSFLKNLKRFTIEDKINYPIYRETSYNYKEIMLNPDFFKRNGVKMFGYFQSYKYFEDNYDNIIKFIKLEELKEECKNKYNIYFNGDNELISLHFRLGDYKTCSDYHPIMNDEYYIKSLYNVIENGRKINKERKNIKVLYFCEKEDNEIVREKIKNIEKELYRRYNIDGVKFVKVDDNIQDWEQLLIMSNCKNNIIANSSFSWWGAYMNENKEKVVCYPSVWFGKKSNNNTSDLCPESWIKI